MYEVNLCTESKEDWIDYTVDRVYEHYNKRGIVLWGKYDQSDKIKERLEKRHGLKISFYVDNDVKKIDDVYIRPKQCLDGRSAQYYVVVPLGFYQSIKDDLIRWGYRKDLDYFYFSDCIVQDTEDYYEDQHGNKIFGRHKDLKICFRGFGSVIKLGKETLLQNCEIYVHNNSKLEIGDKTGIENSHISLGSDASFIIGRSGHLPGGIIVVFEKASMKIGSSFSTGTGYVWAVCECTECVMGEDCMFSYGIYIFTNDGHSIFDVKTGKNINSTYEISRKRNIIIGNHVWVGMGTNILGNAEIGDGSIIGASSLAKGKIPNNCIAAGTPAKVIRTDVAWSRKNMAEDMAECGEEYIHLTSSQREEI